MNFTENPIRVCHLTSVHPADDIRIFIKECRTLAKAGYNVSLIAPGTKCENKEGVRIVGISPSKGGRFFRMTVTTRRVFQAALKEDPHIYHLHDPELLGVGMLLKLLTGKKVIYDVHEDYCKQTLSKSYLPKILRKSIGFLIRIIEYLSSKIFEGIVTATDDILKNFSHHKRAVSIKNFPILSDFSIFRENRDENKEMFNLIYVGGLTEIRGISQIIKALEFIDSNRKFKLILCGRFYPTNYEKEVRSLKGFEKVEYLGWKDPHDIPELLIRADVGIICFLPEPNYIKAMPIKLFEYMATSLPVIASNFPLWKEIVEGNKCGICVDPLDLEAIADAIKYFLKHPEERKKMGNNGRCAVLQKYNWEKESEKLTNLYKELLKNDH